jgi:hypothetical protein
MAEDQQEERQPADAAADNDEDTLFPVKGYIFLNLLFWAFCAGEVLIIRWWLKDVQAVIFFFVLLAAGFTIVSIYDCVYHRLAARSRRPAEPSDATTN